MSSEAQPSPEEMEECVLNVLFNKNHYRITHILARSVTFIKKFLLACQDAATWKEES